MGAAVREVIALAEELSDEERRAARVRAAESRGQPADDVFKRIEAKLDSR
jgi:hypothetical protein